MNHSPRVAWPWSALAGLGAVLTALTLAGCALQRPQQVVQVTRYNDGKGVPLYVSADADKLTGAPKDFRAFMQARVRAAIEQDDASCGEPPVYSVQTVSEVGFAGGTLSQCGVRNLVWAKAAGRWTEVLRYAGEPRCDDLRERDVPPGITGDNCRDGNGSRPYRG